MRTPTLETSKLILRTAQPFDAQAIYDTWATTPNVTKYMRWRPHKSINETHDFVNACIENESNPQYFDWLFVLRETDKPIGSGGIYWNEKHNMFELGYCLAEQFWGQGFAYEASVAIMSFAKQELNAKQFFACHAAENTNSGKILEKLGFAYHSDGEYSTFDGETTFKSRRYFYTSN